MYHVNYFIFNFRLSVVHNGEMMVKINHNITRIFFVSQSNEKIAVHSKH